MNSYALITGLSLLFGLGIVFAGKPKNEDSRTEAIMYIAGWFLLVLGTLAVLAEEPGLACSPDFPENCQQELPY